MEFIDNITNMPMTTLEQMLKALFLQRPDIQSRILTSEELTQYIAWMAHTFGRPTNIDVNALPVRPSSPQMAAIADRLLSDPSDDGAISILSGGYSKQREDQHFMADLDISVSRMLRYMPAHWHTNNYFEIYYAVSGNCAIHFPNEIIDMKPGTVLIVAPTALHASPCYSNNGVLLYYMVRTSTFEQVFWNQLPANSLMATFFRQALNASHTSSYLHFETGGDEAIQRLLMQIYAEYYREDTYKSQLINALMSTFFILLLRKYEGTTRLPRTEEFYWKHEFSAILSHIQTHYATVTLSDLAERFHYSEKQISRIVQSCMGMRYNDLILKLRMEAAARLLRQENTSIEGIAATVGYSTKSSFYRAFCKYYGCTPGEFSENLRKER